MLHGSQARRLRASLPARWAARLRHDRRGAAALDFALISIPLFGIIIFALQTAIIFFFSQALQTLTGQAARQIMVGTAQSMTQAQFTTAICNLAPSVFVCANLMIDVESSSSYATTSTTPLAPTYNPTTGALVPTTWGYNPGSPGSIVIVRIMYDWPVLGGPLSFGLANQPNGAHLMVGTAVIKNEPYQ